MKDRSVVTQVMYVSIHQCTEPKTVNVLALLAGWQHFLLWFQTIGWCAKRASELSFITLASTPIHSDATPLGCQYTRSSTITYNLTNYDTFTRFLCESGDTGTCGTGTAIQYVNITIGKMLYGNMYYVFHYLWLNLHRYVMLLHFFVYLLICIMFSVYICLLL